jgi:hypothetical protein
LAGWQQSCTPGLLLLWQQCCSWFRGPSGVPCGFSDVHAHAHAYSVSALGNGATLTTGSPSSPLSTSTTRGSSPWEAGRLPHAPLQRLADPHSPPNWLSGCVEMPSTGSHCIVDPPPVYPHCGLHWLSLMQLTHIPCTTTAVPGKGRLHIMAAQHYYLVS